MTASRLISSRVHAVVLGLGLAPCGCATTASDFRLAEVQRDEAAIAGRIDVLYNGKQYTKNCSVALGNRIYQLDASGLVLLTVKRGQTELGSVQCQDKSLYHYQFEGAQFFAEGGGVVTYFGNATVDWETDGGLKATDFFGAIGAVIDASSNDGTARMSIVADPGPVQAALVRQVGTSPPLVTRMLTAGR